MTPRPMAAVAAAFALVCTGLVGTAAAQTGATVPALQAAVAANDRPGATRLGVALTAEGVLATLSRDEALYVGDVLESLGKLDEAALAYRHALTLQQAAAPQEPLTAQIGVRLASALQDNRRYGEAEAVWQTVIAAYQKQLPVDVLGLGTAYQRLAITLIARQRAGEALPLLTRTVTMLERRLGKDNPGLASVLADEGLAAAIAANGTPSGPARDALNDRATAAYTRALRLAEAGGPAMTERQNRLRQSLGIHLLVQGQYDEAEPLLREALRQAEKQAGADSLAALTPVSELGILLKETGRRDEADRLARRATAIAARRLPGTDVEVILLNNLAALQIDMARPREALAAARQGAAVETARRGLDAGESRAVEGDARNRDGRVFEVLAGAAWHTARPGPAAQQTTALTIPPALSPDADWSSRT